MSFRRPCLTCGLPTEPGKSRCPAHEAATARERDAKRKARRGPTPVANSVYRYLKEAYEKQGWLVFRCTSCDRDRPMPEAKVDHIKPLADGGADDMANIQVICSECHNTKTIEENRNRVRNT